MVVVLDEFHAVARADEHIRLTELIDLYARDEGLR